MRIWLDTSSMLDLWRRSKTSLLRSGKPGLPLGQPTCLQHLWQRVRASTRVRVNTSCDPNKGGSTSMSLGFSSWWQRASRAERRSTSSNLHPSPHSFCFVNTPHSVYMLVPV